MLSEVLTPDMRILLSKGRPANKEGVFPDKRKRDHARKVTILYLWPLIFPATLQKERSIKMSDVTGNKITGDYT